MYCPTSDSLFLRANGDFVCWDDAGSDLILQRWEPCSDVSAVYSAGGPCAGAALRLSKQRLPQPDVCPGCACLRPYGSGAFNPGVVDVMQVEPSVLCGLSCPACASAEQRAARRQPWIMHPELFEKVLSDFQGAGIAIRAFDFSGHGEPLTNKELPVLLSLAERMQPDSHRILRTNANGEPDPAILKAGLTHLYASIDGVDQESYAPYRVGGDFQKAFAFLREMCCMNAEEGHRTRVVWNYILFEHNSSAEQLEQAWRMACDCGVDELRFVFTHIGRWSRTVSDEKALLDVLDHAGVPDSSIMVNTGKGMDMLGHWKNRLKHCDTAYRSFRRLWNCSLIRGRGARPIITADYCQVSAKRLQDAIGIGLSHLRKGRLEAANELLRHVEERVKKPGVHNRSYDPSEMLEVLGNPLTELKEALRGGCSP